MPADFDGFDGHVSVEDGRVKKGMAKKAQLVDAAMKLISQSGVAAVTQRAVAAAAGLPPSAVTYHFDSVDGLLIAALVSINDRYVAALRSLPDDG